MGPIDYTAPLRAVPNPADAFTQSFQGFNAIRQSDLQQQQQEAAFAQQQQMRADLQALGAKPTPEAIARISLKYPQLSEQFKRSHDMLTADQQQGRLNSAIPVFAAVQNGRTDIASKMLRERATALKNSGQEQEAQQIVAMADLVDQHPETAKLTMGTLLASIMGPEKFATTFSTLGAEGRAAELQPGLVKKGAADAAAAVSDAATKAVTARFAEQAAVLDLQKKGWDIKALQEDIGFKREANRIAAMNAAAAREGNALKREELSIKIQEARAALDDKIRTKVADTESAATAIDNSLNTIERIKKNKSLNDVLGSIEGRLPSVFSDEGADAIALIDTLGSQAFLSQAANLKGMGALSNAEGEKLQSALTNLSRTQSEPQFRANLDEAARLLKKGRETLAKRTGVPVGKPDTPAAPGARPPLSSFFTKPGG